MTDYKGLAVHRPSYYVGKEYTPIMQYLEGIIKFAKVNNTFMLVIDKIGNLLRDFFLSENCDNQSDLKRQNAKLSINRERRKSESDFNRESPKERNLRLNVSSDSVCETRSTKIMNIRNSYCEVNGTKTLEIKKKDEFSKMIESLREKLKEIVKEARKEARKEASTKDVDYI